MKVFVINMKKDSQRRKDMSEQLNELEIDYEYFLGVDGNKIGEDDLSAIADIPHLEKNKGQPIEELRGLVGCTYSHYLIYQKMVSENLDMACVLEDDVILSKHFTKQLSWLEKHISGNEIISLHTLLYDPVDFKPSDRGNEICGICVPSPPKIRGTQGYVITRHCAEQLMQEMMPIQEFPDCFNRYQLFCPDVQIRVLFPFILRHMWIDSVRDDKKIGLMSKLIGLIQGNRIFPFWNLIKIRRRKINDAFISSFVKHRGQKVKSLYVSDLETSRFFSKY